MVALVAPVVAAAMVLTACGGGSSDGQKLKGADQQQQGLSDINAVDVAKLKDGGEFKWPIDNMPDNWNYNEVDGTVADGARMINAMFPLMFTQNADASLKLNKDYLDSADLTSKDPEVVTYKINPKAKWSDGTPITWEDFQAQATALSGKDKAYQVSSTTGYEDIDKVEKGASPQEVKVTFKKKFAEWTSLFSPLYPKSLNATADEFNKGWVDKPKVTAGAFKIGTIDLTGKLVTIERDPSWWGDKAKLDKITFRVIERKALADSLANGAIDWYDIGSSVDNYTRAKQMQDISIRQAVTPDYTHMTFNGAPTSVLADPKLRLAVMQGLDTATIAKALLGQITPDPKTLGNHIFLIGAKEYKDNSSVAKFDAAAANKALDDLGWKKEGDFRKKDGKDLKLRYIITAGNNISQQISQLSQTQLKAIGVNLDIVTVPAADFWKSYVNVGNFDITGFRWLSNSWPISSGKSIYYLDKDNVAQNYGRVGNDTINGLFDKANAELDDSKRAEIANQLDTEIWKAGHQLPIYQAPGAVAVRKTIANFGAVGYANNPYDYTKIGFTS
ncbi:ABC transporter family substrate-binding protein [Solihabitans fulvus]|uniref:ABC transporter family substrate-binding protein n=1 Tax=Solihabitans fulvus TaxID=1892852 RepID=A0A5B2XHI7_9PSEU|nr:ABC transporter family substrate-binding protein [Solihabitans fulvus]